MQLNTTDMDLKQNTVRFSPSARAKSFSLVFGIHFPERQFKVRKPNAFSQPVTTNRPAFLPAAAASQIYLPVLWKWPWLLDIHAAGSQRGREGGRSLFPGLQEVTLLLFLKKKEKSRCILGNPWLPMWESQAHAQSVSHGGENTYDTRSLGSGRWRSNSKIRNDRLLQGKWESLVRNVSRNDSRTDGQMVNLPVSLKGNREVKDCVCVSGGMNSAWQWVYDEFTNMQVWRWYEVWVCVCVSMYAAVWSMRDLFRVEWPRVQIRS